LTDIGSIAVAVVWHDAHADRSGGWVLPADIDADPYRVTSVGWRIEPKVGHVSLAQSVGDDGAYDHVLHIPDGMVIEVIEL
jgi:hypothetical protein